MMQINQRIKNERIRAGLSEEDMAAKLDIPRSTYQYWEEKTPRVEKIKAVAKALNLREDYFFVSYDENAINAAIPVTPENPTVELLAQALADQAKANRDHSEGYKTLAEAYKEMIELLRDLRNQMARENTQATLKIKIDEIAASLEDSKEVDLLAAKHFEQKFVELAKLVLQGRSDEKPPSLGGGNRQGENDEGDHKHRKKRS